MATYFEWIQRVTETFLTKRSAKIAANKEAKKVKRTFKGELLGWLDAIVFAVFFVLIINQYLFQLFMIPSPSMVATLLIKDRVFVSKTSYGVELYPGGPKILDSITPLRDDVIVFYNPEYESKGALFDLLSQIIYMGTFSLVNIDVDEAGNMRERLYVKRAAALEGEIVTFENGKAFLRGGGMPSAVDETLFRSKSNLSTAPHQSIEPSLYDGLNSYGALLAYQDENLGSVAPSYHLSRYKKVQEYQGAVDYYQVEKSRSLTLSHIDPSNLSYRSDAARYQNGIYVPENSVLPLGDNRDNSQDGRYFGPVPIKKVIGSVKFRFWPLNRMGLVQ